MRKFFREDSEGNEVEMFTTNGVLRSISKDFLTNTNGTKFYRFTADIEMPRGSITCLGQVYEGSLEFLGDKPEVGKNYAFSTTVDALLEKNNKIWSIVGTNVDDISDDVLNDINSMINES